MGKRIAFLVGINDYGEDSYLSKLNYAEADAELMADTLETVSGFSTKILLGKQATRSEIVQGLETFYYEDDLDLFLFYFAGHGELIREVGMHCLHCYKSEIGDTIGTLNLQDWANRIKRKIPTHQIIMVVDACRNKLYRGMLPRGTQGLDSSVPSALKEISDNSQHIPSIPKYMKPRLMFTMLSCSVDQVSYEDNELKHGIFTYALAKEIKENGAKLPINQLSKKVGEFTYNRCVKKHWSPLQVPELIEPSLSTEIYLVESLKDNLPGDDKILGKAVSNIFDTHPSLYGTQGYVRRYEKGPIYSIKKMGNPKRELAKIKDTPPLRIIDSHIELRYEAMGASRSKLGFPIGEVKKAWGSQTGNRKSQGIVQSFEGGNIYFCEGCGAHSLLVGSIKDLIKKSERDVFETQKKKLTGGLYGFPVSEQMEVTSISHAIGNVQRFEYGLIIDWSAGVYGIIKGFYNVYQSLGEWNCPLGFPASNEEPITSSISGVTGCIQYFENGCMVLDEKSNRCIYIVGEIYSKWKQDIKRYGFPKNNPYQKKVRVEQHFEGGIIRADHANFRDRKILPQISSLSKKQLDALFIIHNKISRNLSSLLSFYLTSKVNVRLHSLEELTYSDFIDSLKDPTFINTILMKPLRESSILEINPKILLSMIDIGKRDEYNEENRTINDFDKGLIDVLVKAILESFEKGWEEVYLFNMSVIQNVTSPQSLDILISSEKVIVFSFELTVAAAQGIMHFCIPNTLVQSIAHDLYKMDLP